MRRFAALFLVGACLFSWPAQAQTGGDVVVDLELVIAVDVSLSMDLDEQTLQREGYVKAFLDPQVINAIEQGIHGKIAVAYVVWAGAISQYLNTITSAEGSFTQINSDGTISTGTCPARRA